VLVLLAERNGGYRTVLSDIASPNREPEVLRDGTAILNSHDSAIVSDRRTYRWNGTTYALVKSERLNAQLGAVKPMFVPIAFAGGASSASLTGKAASGFGDSYVLSASAGQRMTLTLSAPNRGSVTLFRGNCSSQDCSIVAEAPGIGSLPAASAHWTGRLPADGEYQIDVNCVGETLRPYTLTVTIH
jgi:hypothetical protein